MNKKMPALFLLWMSLTLLGGCQAQEVAVTRVVEAEVTRIVTETEVLEGEAVEVTRVVTEVVEVVVDGSEIQSGNAPPVEPASNPADPPANEPANEPAEQPAQQQRLIIKDGQLQVVVRNTEVAVNTATQFVVQFDGYIISQQMYDNDQGYRFAEMRVAVPVTRFEEAMRTFRALGEVRRESSSGEDVTEQYVDLNSRLTNLEATRDRLRSFLVEADDVEQALEVNEELKQIEEEIAVIEGRLNYLQERAAFSTVDLTLEPWIPTPTPTATATATPSPTPTPLPTAEVWRPGDTAQLAAVELQETAQQAADFTIYNLIVWGPWLLLIVPFAIWQGRLLWRRRPSTNLTPTERPTPTPEEDSQEEES